MVLKAQFFATGTPSTVVAALMLLPPLLLNYECSADTTTTTVDYYQTTCAKLCNDACSANVGDAAATCVRGCIDEPCSIIIDTMFACTGGLRSCVEVCNIGCFDGMKSSSCNQKCRNVCTQRCSGRYRSPDKKSPAYTWEILKLITSRLMI